MDSETTYLLVKDVIYEGQEEEMVGFSDEEENKISISISSINPKIKKQIENEWNLLLHDEQLVIRINVEFPNKKPVKFYEKEMLLHKDIIFSLIVCIRNFHIVWEQGHERMEMDFTGGTGVGLPFFILRFIEEGKSVNVFYANDYDKVISNYGFFVVFDKENVSAFQYILKRVLIENKQAIPKFIMESFSLIHTVNWVKEGWFYPAVIILFSCFESLLNKKERKQIKDLMISRDINISEEEENDLEDFQILRNAIAHPSEHKILLENNTYRIYKKGKLKATFDIKKLENVRKILINLIVHQLSKE